MTSQRRIRAAVFGVGLLALASPAAAQRNLFRDPSNRYSIEFPKDWKWTIVEGAGEPLSTFVHPKAEAAIVVERFRMKIKLDQDQISDVFTTIEVDSLKENQPRVMDVTARTAMHAGRKVVQIDYRRPGVGDSSKAEDQRVRQFSFPVAGSVYRITCAALASQFGKYEAIFQWSAESLKSAEELGK